ncbi:MAG TPA: fructosamine kinase family protein [Methyloceanibacter sp.]|jgi:fructosamine-3-kinase|nr:fructosamine kinase family protein [Methyloceanibacter sp.]
MGASNTTLTERLETALGARVIALALMPVGFGLAGYKVDLAGGRKLAVKLREGSQRADLSLEAYMLGELARHSDLPVPAVHVAEQDLLVMDFIENDCGGITPDGERHAAELIAALHATPRPSFGYERDTLIGPLPQPNPKIDRWIPFFRDHRLLAMARGAEAEGKLPVKLLTRLERLGERLPEYLTEPPAPSLLHGDLWTGNVLVRGNRVAGFVDPAIYWGHPEIELAFTTMFGTFGQAFFDAYEALLPLEPGFHELRSALYKLYPTLVHVRLFGSAYLPPIEQTLARVGL